jgi:hypothetical protein
VTVELQRSSSTLIAVVEVHSRNTGSWVPRSKINKEGSHREERDAKLGKIIRSNVHGVERDRQVAEVLRAYDPEGYDRTVRNLENMPELRLAARQDGPRVSRRGARQADARKDHRCRDMVWTEGAR